MRFLLLAALLTATALAANATRDDELIAQLKEQIAQLEKAPASESQNIFGFDSDRVARRLGVLRKELAVIEKRRQLEAQEKNLRMTINAQPREQLRAKTMEIAKQIAGNHRGAVMGVKALMLQQINMTLEQQFDAEKSYTTHVLRGAKAKDAFPEFIARKNLQS